MGDSITLINSEPIKDWIKKGPISLPLGLAALAAYLTERGIKVNLCDINLNEKLEEETDWYGITARLTSRPSFIGELIPSNGKVVFGGPDPSADPEYYLELGKYVIRSEGEKALYELITNTNSSTIPNLSYKTSAGVQHNPLGPLIDMNELPIPAYELFDVMKYADTYENRRGLRWLTIAITRGCPYDCNFCAHKCVFGRSWRAPTPSRAVDMMEKLLGLGELRGLEIGDAIFGYDVIWAEAVCREIIRRKLSFKWISEMRVDCVSPSSLSLMVKAGSVAVLYGLESGSQKTLDAMNKQTTVEKGRRAVALTDKNRMLSILTFVIGTPGETEADLEKTEAFWDDLLDKYFCVISTNIYHPLKASSFYERYGEQMSEIPRERLEGAITRIKLRMEEKYGSDDELLIVKEEHQ